jgi:hypothetical protein
MTAVKIWAGAGLLALAFFGGSWTGAATDALLGTGVRRPWSGLACCRTSSPLGSVSNPVARAVLAFAFQRLGAGYSMIRRYGPRSFDCSSLVFLAFRWVGIRVGDSTPDWLEADSPMRRFEITGRPAAPGDVIIVPRWVLNKHFAEQGHGFTDFNHALIAARTDPVTGRVTWVVDASGSLGVTFRRAPAYVHYPGVRLFRPR